MVDPERYYGPDGALPPDGLPRPPRSSFAHGAAGIAYILLRHAAIAGEPQALNAAGQWMNLAERDLAPDSRRAVVGRSRGRSPSRSRNTRSERAPAFAA